MCVYDFVPATTNPGSLSTREVPHLQTVVRRTLKLTPPLNFSNCWSGRGPVYYELCLR